MQIVDTIVTEGVLAQVLSEVFEYSPLPFCITTAEENSRYVRVNSAFLTLIGRTWEEIADREIVQDMTVSLADPGRSRRQAKLRSEGFYEMEEVDLRHSSGRVVPTLITAYRRSIDGTNLDIEIIQDNSHRKAYELSLMRTAMTDGLTGLSNRAAFEEALFDIAAGGDDGNDFCLVFMDLNKFKEINDGLGHAAGDHLLQVIAHRLQAAAGLDDVVARLGGDEFGAIILPGDGRDMTVFLEELAASVSRDVEIDGLRVSVGISIGSCKATTPTDGRLMLLYADQLMYEAKATGQLIAVREGHVDDYTSSIIVQSAVA